MLKEDKNYNAIAYYSDGSNVRVYGQQLHNSDVDYWKGWRCDAGFNRIFVFPDGSVYGGECRNDYLGNLNDQFNILDQQTICQRDRCSSCTSDLILAKNIDKTQTLN